MERRIKYFRLFFRFPIHKQWHLKKREDIFHFWTIDTNKTYWPFDEQWARHAVAKRSPPPSVVIYYIVNSTMYNSKCLSQIYSTKITFLWILAYEHIETEWPFFFFTSILFSCKGALITTIKKKWMIFCVRNFAIFYGSIFSFLKWCFGFYCSTSFNRLKRNMRQHEIFVNEMFLQIRFSA